MLLPPNAPAAWQDRAELWNAVEDAEKSKDNQLARELIVALPVELGLDEWKTMLCDFLSEQCVGKGMCADYSIHDTDGHNPHAHILLTVRPLDNKGKWQAKTQKEYLCKRGDEERGFTADEFKTAQSDGWEKQYQYYIGKKKVYMTPSEAVANNYERVNKYPKSTRYGRQNPVCAEWNSEEQLLKWRKAWETAVNKALENNNISERIDCRSFKERGIDEQPTIHEGVTARIIEQRGGVSDRCEINRQIKSDNALVRELKALVKELTEKVKKSVSAIAAALESVRDKLIFLQYQMNFNEERSSVHKQENLVIDDLLGKYRKITQNITDKTAERKKLKSKKSKLPIIHILRHRDLANAITTLTEDIEKLKTRKNMILGQMRCGDDKQVAEVKQRYKNNVAVINQLDTRNTALQQEKANAKAEYEKIRADIVPTDVDAVQDERHNIRERSHTELVSKLKDIYGQHYSSIALKRAIHQIHSYIHEKPFKRKSIRERLQQNQQQLRQRKSIRRK